MQEPQIIQGATFEDERGILRYNNDFNLDQIKRFYSIEHPKATITRAWQGHKLEQKWFQVVKGSFLVLLVKPDDWNNPSFSLKPLEFILSEDKNEVLHVPGGYYNGFKALRPDSKILVFSNFTLEESKADDYRVEPDRWYYESFM